NVEISTNFQGESQEGELGDSLSFTVPESASDSVTVEATYTLSGQVETELELAPEFSLSASLLSGNITAKVFNFLNFQAGFGPV
ncbi:hypothetical protein, partial [Tritonibacter sp. SIMBA_163]|uniref:hypothetical protein n=1 Tax=Tritonibacter sp. SIMBA_163 TaxID=3080868 RepID=UPI0039808EC1